MVSGMEHDQNFSHRRMVSGMTTIRHFIKILAAIAVLFGTAFGALSLGVAPASAAVATGFFPATGVPGGGGFCISPGAAVPAGTYHATYATDGQEATAMWFADNWGPNGNTFTNAAGITINGMPGSSSTETTVNSTYHASSALMGVPADSTTTNPSLNDAIQNFANSYPGPWSLQDHFPAGPWTVGQSYSGSIDIVASNGAIVLVNGIPIALKVNTNNISVVDGNGSESNSGVMTYTFKPLSTGSFSGSFSASDLAAAHATAYVSTQGRPVGTSGYQMLVAPVNASASTPFSGTTATPVRRFGALEIHKNDAVRDSAGGLLPLAGAKFHISGPTGYTANTLITPPTGTIDGHTVGGHTLTKLQTGTYTITETAPPPGFALASPATQTVQVLPTATATVSFADPPTPAKIVTTTSAVFMKSGQTVQDGIVVSTIPTNPGINSTVPDETPMNWLLVGPVAMDPTGQCSSSDYAHGPDAGSGQIPLHGNGTYTTAAVTVHDAGCYGWIDSIPANPYTQGGISFPNAPAPSSELSYLLPSLTTAAHAAGASAPATFTDTVTVGAITTEPSHITWTLYGPVPPLAGGTCPTTKAAYPLTTLADLGTIDVRASGTYKATAGVRSAAGCYSFGAALASTASPPAYNPTSQSPGTAAETLYLAPTITTAAHQSSSTVGATLTDTATVTGVTGEPSQITYTVEGPVHPTGTGKTGSVCSTTAAAWASAPKFTTGTLAVTKSGTYKLTATPKVTVAGCYTWTEGLASIATPPAYGAVSTAPGTAAETLYLAPTITTKASDSRLSVSTPGTSTTLADTVTVTGITGVPSKVSWSVAGPVAPGGAKCPSTPAAYKKAPLFATGTLAVTKSGTYKLTATKTGSPVPVTVAGCYTWTEGLASTATPPAYQTVSTVQGTPSETVRQALTFVTKAQSKILPGPAILPTQPGVPMRITTSDQVTIYGLAAGQTAKLQVQLMGPAPVKTGQHCTSATWAKAPVANTQTLTVTGTATPTLVVTTKPVVVSPPVVKSDDCWSYADTLSSTSLATVTFHSAGTPSETFQGATGTGGGGGGGGTKRAIITGGGKPPTPGPGFPIGLPLAGGALLILVGGVLLIEPLRRKAGTGLLVVTLVGAVAVSGGIVGAHAAGAVTLTPAKGIVSTHLTQSVTGGTYSLKGVTCRVTHCIAVGWRKSASLGSSGVVITSTTRGKSWSVPTPTVPQYLSSTQHSSTGSVTGGPTCGPTATSSDAWNAHGCYGLTVVQCASVSTVNGLTFSHCLAAGGGNGTAYLWATVNGGGSWRDLSPTIPDNGNLNGIVSLSFTTAAAGDAVLVSHTTTTPPTAPAVMVVTGAFGASPRFTVGSLSPDTGYVSQVWCTSSTTCIGVGTSVSGYPATYRVADGGTTWSETTLVPSSGGKGTLSGLACRNTTDCLAVGRIAIAATRVTDRAVAITGNAGLTWTLVPVGWNYSQTTLSSGGGVGGYEFTGAVSCDTTSCAAAQQYLTLHTPDPSLPETLVMHMQTAPKTLQQGTVVKLTGTIPASGQADVAAGITIRDSNAVTYGVALNNQDGVVGHAYYIGSSTGHAYGPAKGTNTDVMQPATVASGNVTCTGTRCIGTSAVGEEQTTGAFQTYTISGDGTLKPVGAAWEAPLKSAYVESRLVCVPGKATCFRGLSPVNNTSGAMEPSQTVTSTPAIAGEVKQAEESLITQPGFSSGTSELGAASCTSTTCYLVSGGGLLTLTQSGTKLASVGALTPMPPNYKFSSSTTKYAVADAEIIYDGGLTCSDIAGKGTCLLPTTSGIYQSPMTGTSLSWTKVSTLITYTASDRNRSISTNKTLRLTGNSLACSPGGKTCLAFGPSGAEATSLTTPATSSWHAAQSPPLSAPTTALGQHPGSNLVCVTSGQCAFAVVTYSVTFANSFPFTMSTADVTTNAGTSWSQTPLGASLHPIDQPDTTLSCAENTTASATPRCFLSVAGLPSWLHGADTAATPKIHDRFTMAAELVLSMNIAPAVAPPTITTVRPTTGPTTGGTTVTVTGTCLTAPSAVAFGGKAVESFKATSPTRLTAVTEAHTAGKVAVSVTSKCGTVTDPTVFTYVAPVPAPPPPAPTAPTPTATPPAPAPSPAPAATPPSSAPGPTPTPVSIITGGGLGRHRDSASDAVLGWLAGGVIMLVLAAVMLLTNAYSRRRTRRAP